MCTNTLLYNPYYYLFSYLPVCDSTLSYFHGSLAQNMYFLGVKDFLSIPVGSVFRRDGSRP